MGRLVYVGHRRQTLSINEEWRQEPNGMWQLYDIIQHTTGNATMIKIGLAITEKEYFIQKLSGET